MLLLQVASLLDALLLIQFTIRSREGPEQVMPVSLVQLHPVLTPHMPYFFLTDFHDEAAVETLATNWFMSLSGIRLMSTRFQKRDSTYVMSCASRSERRLDKNQWIM
jgi:hypothetical protein